MSTSRAAGDRNRRRPTRRPATAAAPQVVPVPAVGPPVTVEGDAAPAVSFAALGVPAPLCAALARGDITVPFPIQAAALPSALAGRDVLGRGRTGSGKTVAFAVPLIAALAAKGRRSAPKRPRGLVLVPTRELATQVAETLAPLAAAVGLRTVTVMGGVGMGPQVTALRRGVDVVVACPGRLEDLIGQGHCALDAIDVTVIDEADHMADLGFLPAVRRILDRTPSGTQRLLFSATLDNGIDVLVRRYLNDPVTHSVDSASVPQAAMAHHVFTVSTADKAAAGIPAGELHSNLSQGVRTRNLAAFGDGSTLVLVATDIAARGIHVDDIGLVVHVDPPAEHKAFLHRSGRTARAGADGIVVTLATPEQRADVHAIARKAGIRPATAAVSPGDTRIAAIVGPPAPLVRPRPQVADRPAAASRPRRNRPRRSVA